MTEEQRDEVEQYHNKKDSKFMTITKFAWDEKVDRVKTLKQQNKQLIEAMSLLRTQAWEYTLSIKLANRMTKTIDDALQQIQGDEGE